MERVLECRELEMENGERVEVKYLLVTNESQNDRVRTYGIGIQKLNEKEVVEKLTESEEKAKGWIDKLARNQITPMCLIEVLDELISRDGI